MEATMLSDDLKRIVKSTAKFISKDVNRFILQYIRLDFDKETQKAQGYAMDGYRISVESAKCTTDESFTAYIKPYLPVGAKSEIATIKIADGNCYVEMDGRIVGYYQPKDTPINFAEILENLQKGKVKYRIGVSEFFMLDMLKSIQHEDRYTKTPLMLEFREPVQPIIHRTKSGLRAILPIKLGEWEVVK